METTSASTADHKTANETVEQDEFLQESLEETFPASDPISPGHPRRKQNNADSDAKGG